MVLREHGCSLDLNLTVFGDAKRETGERDADRTLMIWHTQHVERARRGGLGQTITFVDRDIRTTEERQKLRIERGASCDDPLGASAKHLAQCGIDHWIEGRATSLGNHTGLALDADLLHIVLRGDHRRCERDALGAMSGLLRSRVVHLLQHTRNHDHH